LGSKIRLIFGIENTTTTALLLALGLLALSGLSLGTALAGLTLVD